MQRSLVIFAIMLLGLLGLTTHASKAMAQAPSGCGFCVDEPYGTGWKHKFGATGALFSCLATSGGCHSDWLQQTCGLHNACPIISYDDAARAIREVERASLQSNSVALDQVMRRYKGRLLVNVKSGTIDVHNCAGVLMGRVKISPHLLHRVSA